MAEVKATMPQEVSPVDEWTTGEDDWLRTLTSLGGEEAFQQEAKPSRQQSAEDDYAERIRRLENELMAYRYQMYLQQLTNAINQRISAFLANEPMLQPFEDEIRTRVGTKVAQWLSAEVAKAGGDPKKISEIYDINNIVNKSMEFISEEAQALKTKLEKVLGTSGSRAPTSLPNIGMTPTVSASSTEEEKFPGYSVPLSEEAEIRIVPEDYLDKIRQKQLKEWLRDRIQLDMKRRQALTHLGRASLGEK